MSTPTGGNLLGGSLVGPQAAGLGSGSDPTGLTGTSSSGLAASTSTGWNYQPTSTDQVWVGPRALGKPTTKLGQIGQLGMTTYGDAQGLVGNWFANDPQYYKQLMNKMIMYKYGGVSADSGLPEVMSAWDDLLKTSIVLNKQGNGTKQWTPFDVLESYNKKPGSMGTRKVGDFLIDNATGEKVKYVGPKTKTTNQSQVDLSNADQVQAVATDALTKLIGRAPTAKELAQFKSTLNGYEKSNPSVATTTETYDDMGNVVNTATTTTGGVDDAARAALIGKGVQKTPEYAKFQGGATYFNALMSMLGG